VVFWSRCSSVFWVVRVSRVSDHRVVARLVGSVGHRLDPAVGERHIIHSLGQVVIPRLLVAKVVVVLVFYSVLPVIVGINLLELKR